MFALGKYIQLFESVAPAKAGDIGRLVQNILHVSITYSGSVYFYYTMHLWSKLFGSSRKAWGGNFYELDNLALTAATHRAAQFGQSGNANFCDHCVSHVSHESACCPFTVKEGRSQGATSSTASSSKLVQAKSEFNKSVATGAKNSCNFFNSNSGCKIDNGKCRFQHVCSWCGSFRHSLVNCNENPSSHMY